MNISGPAIALVLAVTALSPLAAQSDDQPIIPTILPDDIDGIDIFAMQRDAESIATGKPDTKFAGHYYLNGVMETGSELLLKPDGSFAWYLSVGSLDQNADGRWVRDGDFIVLHVPFTPSTKPIIALGQRLPWDQSAERGLAQTLFDEALNKAYARCPFAPQYPRIAAASPAIPVSSETSLLNPNTLKLAILRQAAINARSSAQEAAEKAMAAAAQQTDALELEEFAVAAIRSWDDAKRNYTNALEDAGETADELTEPVVPAACGFPEAIADGPLPESTWRKGIAIKVIDPEGVARYGSMAVTIRYSNGKEITGELDESGSAYFPRSDNGAATSVVLDALWLPQKAQPLSIAVPSLSENVQILEIPHSTLYQPPFTYLRLKIDGRTLSPDLFGQGRYVKSKSKKS